MGAFAPGETLDGRYELVRPLGSGGMGEVFVARRLALGDLVAIKRLHAAQDTAINRARFLGEARAAAHIQHPNVVRVFDFGDPAGATPYLVMELLDGPTLGAELAVRGRLPAAEAVALFAPICAAVEAGHRRGVVHRDLKPANVILAQADDGTRVVKVLDFGLAVMGGEGAVRLTSPGTIVGTVSYMAPEQVAGLPSMPASDLFALGVILYELVTGVLPFEAESQIATLFRISQGQYRPARELVMDLPRAVDDAILAALQPDPSRRPSGPEQLATIARGGGRSMSGEVAGRAATEPATGVEPTAVVATPGSSSGARRIAMPAPRLDVFVGRVPELSRLEDEHRESIAGHGRLLAVTGDDGEGRSRLVETFARRAAAGGSTVLTARFLDDAQAPLHEPFARMLAGAQSRPGSGELRRMVDGGVASVLEAIVARAGVRPTVLILDDLHLARPAELEVVDAVRRDLEGALVVATASAAALRRGGGAATWLAAHVQRRSAIAVRLRPFGIADVRAWLDAAFGVVHVRPRDLRRLAAAAGGNPFFLAETVRHLVAIEAIRRRDDEWIIEIPDDLEAPPTVAALVDARTGGLDAELVGVLELASAGGDDLDFARLAVASGLDEDRLDAALEHAVAEGLLTRDGLAPGCDYRFASALLRAALYARLSPRARRRAHKKLLDAPASASADPERELLLRSIHRAALDELPGALADALGALAAAVERGDADIAEAALSRARQATARLDAGGTPPGDAARARLDHLGGVVSARVGRMGDARALLSRAREAARRAGDGALELDVLLELAMCQIALGDLEGAISGAAHATTAARTHGDRLRAARGAATLSVALHRRGRYDDAGQIAGEIADDESLPPAVRAWAFRNRAWVHFSQGRFAAGDIDADRALVLARGAGDPTVLWLALNARAAGLTEHGDHPAGRSALEESLELARRTSMRRFEAISLANLGEGAWEQGDAERALECFREALSIFLDIEDRACEGDCRVNVGRAMLALGERLPAIAMLERGLALCDATGRAEYGALAKLHLGEARLADGDAAGARDLIADARQRLDALGSHQLWRAELMLAQAALLDTDRDRARYHARRAQEHVGAQRAHLSVASQPAFDRLTRPVRDLIAELS